MKNCYFLYCFVYGNLTEEMGEHIFHDLFGRRKLYKLSRDFCEIRMTQLLLTLGEKRCDYCCHILPAEGNSSWDGKQDSLHYKHVDCSRCGKENWLKVDF